jgi:hypothetical protein
LSLECFGLGLQKGFWYIWREVQFLLEFFDFFNYSAIPYTGLLRRFAPRNDGYATPRHCDCEQSKAGSNPDRAAPSSDCFASPQ